MIFIYIIKLLDSVKTPATSSNVVLPLFGRSQHSKILLYL
jgi:hypothetical protein